MRRTSSIAAMLRDFPRIFFACHRRHTPDPFTQKLVSEKQMQILEHLDPERPMSLSDLARHLGVTLGTMSVAADRLVERRYILRETDESDRRRIHLRLTEEGRRLCEARSVLDPDLVRHLLRQLKPDERARAQDGLSLLARAAEGMMATRAKRLPQQEP